METENSNAMNEIDTQEQAVVFSLKRFFLTFFNFLKSVLSLKEGVDFEATSEGLKQDVHFRGHAAWILMFSILIASIGLNTNSVAVIIGAMLISPLMGPILAIGLAVAVNDFELLKRAIKNFAVAIGISLAISSLYFLISPIKEASMELMDRRSATVLALAVALFGGAAGIIAGSRSYKSNVVPGVAIATALMPPLCTAGYGLATLQWSYFFGAFYLFFINSVFIALPTYLYIKYMRFPVVQFVDPIREKKIKRYILLFLAVVIVPSAIIFVQVVQQTIFQRNAVAFVQEVESSLNGTDTAIITKTIEYNDGKPDIKLALMGEVLPERNIENWKLKLAEFNLTDCQFSVIQSKDYMSLIKDVENKTEGRRTEWLEKMIAAKDDELKKLKDEQLKAGSTKIDFISLQNECKILFPGLSQFYYADGIESNFSKQDTIPALFVRFKAEVNPETKLLEMSKMKEWIGVQLKRDSVLVLEY